VLRHNFANLAADLGYFEATIETLVGHKGHSVTLRYLHAADAVMLAVADAVAERMGGLMGEASPNRRGALALFLIACSPQLSRRAA
jgi:hypothetical protein